MKTPPIALTLLAALGTAVLHAGDATPPLQPFVDKHELAGAVALVADKDKVLGLQGTNHPPNPSDRE